MSTNEISLSVLRRSASEILACSVMRLFPDTLLVSGDSNELGFFYDFVFAHQFTETDLILVEEQMRALIKEGLPIRSLEMMRENAANFFSHHGQSIQSSVALGIQENIISVVQIGDFYDYCPLPHLASTDEVGAFKLLHVAERDYLLSGIEEEGDDEDEDEEVEEEVLMTRISGTAFPDQMALKQHLKRLDLAKKRDHKMLGSQMDLFVYSEEGDGDWIWFPRGACIRDIFIDWWRDEMRLRKFQPVLTPLIVLSDKPFSDEESSDRSIQHALVYQAKSRTEAELPIRYAEWIQYFNEDEGGEDGLFDPLTCSSDVESVFCKKEQLLSELNSFLQFIDKTIKMLGLEYSWFLVHAHREFQPFSSEEGLALNTMKKAFAETGFAFTLDEQEGDLSEVRAEVRISDAIGRHWKCSSVKIDFETPKERNLSYREKQGSSAVPSMVILSMMGSLERLIALLIEHKAGLLPLWLVPEQVRIIAVGQQTLLYAGRVYDQMIKFGLRAGVDFSDDKLGTKIHRAEQEKIPYMLIIGDKEQSKNEITVRSSSQEELSQSMSIEAFLEHLQKSGSIKRGEGKTL